MIYKGSCHCKKIVFEAEGEIGKLMECNCSICSKKASLLFFIPKESFRLLSGESDIASYTFNKHLIKHKFCKKCGIHPYGEGKDPSGKETVAINARCLDEINLKDYPIISFDGKSL